MAAAAHPQAYLAPAESREADQCLELGEQPATEDEGAELVAVAAPRRVLHLGRAAAGALAIVALAGCVVALLSRHASPATEAQAQHVIRADAELADYRKLPDECLGFGCDWVAKFSFLCETPKDTKAYRCCCDHGMKTDITGLLSLKANKTACINIKARNWEDELINKPSPLIRYDAVAQGPCQFGNRNMEFDVPKWGPGLIRLADEPRKCLGVSDSAPGQAGDPVELRFCGKGQWLGTPKDRQQWKVDAVKPGQIQWSAHPDLCLDLQPASGLTIQGCEEDSSAQIFEMQKPEVPGKRTNPSLFCTALMMPSGYEVGLVRAQALHEVGIFQCDEYAVFTNTSIELYNKKGDTTTVMAGSMDAPRGGKYMTALNTKIFIRFWDAVIKDERSSKHDWIVKVDPDAVFFADRLRELLRLSFQPEGVVDKPTYINNCYLGLHGPIEVLSKQALSVYKDGAAECRSQAEKHGQEDVFLRDCLDLLHIDKYDAYNILYEEKWACNERDSTRDTRPPCFSHQVAFHPYKTEESYFECYAKANSQKWLMPMYPISEKPAGYNFHHA